jgi:nuclear GTP-binding protein
VETTIVYTKFNMGSGKKEVARRERQGKGGDGLDNVKIKGENFYR